MDFLDNRYARFGSHLGVRQALKVLVLSNGIHKGAQTIVFVVLESPWRSNYYFCRANNLATARGADPSPLRASLKQILEIRAINLEENDIFGIRPR